MLPKVFKLNLLYILYFLFIFNQITIITCSTPNDIKNRIQTEIDSLNNSPLLKKILNSGGLSDCDSVYCYQISYIDSQYIKNQEQKYPQIILTEECKKNLIESFSSSNLVITKIFIKNKFESNSANFKSGINAISDIIYYQIYSFNENNNKISTLSINPEFTCGKNLVHYNPVYVNDNLNNKILSISSQSSETDTDIKYLTNYDILDPDSNFYNDICTPITFTKYSINSEKILDMNTFKNFDMTLSLRKINYFPGKLSLCSKDCQYLGFDPKTFSVLCQCEFEDFSNALNPYKIHNEYNEFDINVNDFFDKNKDSYFSYNVLKCFKLTTSNKGLKDNYGNYITLIINFLIFIYYITLMCYKFSYITTILQNVAFNLKEEDKKKIEQQQLMKNADMNADFQHEKSKFSDAALIKNNNLMLLKKNNPEVNNNENNFK